MQVKEDNNYVDDNDYYYYKFSSVKHEKCWVQCPVPNLFKVYSNYTSGHKNSFIGVIKIVFPDDQLNPTIKLYLYCPDSCLKYLEKENIIFGSPDGNWITHPQLLPRALWRAQDQLLNIFNASEEKSNDE